MPPLHRHRALVAIALPALLASAGCEDDAELTGSLKEAYGIVHQDVRVRLTSSEIAIEYVGARGSVPVRATVDLSVVGAPRAGRFELPAEGWIGGRLVNETELPRLVDGEIVLDAFTAEDGAIVRGSFSGRFDAGRDELGLGGNFEEPLELLTDLGAPAPPPPMPEMDGGVP